MSYKQFKLCAWDPCPLGPSRHGSESSDKNDQTWQRWRKNKLNQAFSILSVY